MSNNNRAVCAFAAFISCMPFLSCTAVATTVGRTQGSFDVSPTGGASYTIPIWVPQGSGHIQPNLTLSYNSQGSQGTMGVGWILGGLS